MSANRAQRAGGNLLLASLLAVFSYVPFEYIAKTTLLVCLFLFVADPFPPTSRLVALVATIVVGLLSRAERHWQEQQQLLVEEKEVVETSEKEKKS